MAPQTEVRFNLNGLGDLKKNASEYRTRVGILGSDVERPDSEISNSEIGFIQMFGSFEKNIPPRDFLLMPIEYNKQKLIRAMHRQQVKAAIRRGEWRKVFALLGAVAEGFVQEAFETSGFGQWEPNKQSTIDAKGSSRPLIDTSELRTSVTSDVKKKGEI